MRFEELIEVMINDFLDREIRERSETIFYPSELHFCIRKNYLMYKKPKKFDIGLLKIFEAGNIVHTFFRDVIFKSYTTTDLIKKFDYEGSLLYKGDGFEISGRFDDIIVIEWEEKPVLIEVKTVRSLRFFKDVKRHHLMQTNFYLTMLNLDKGHIVYIDRSNLQHRIFEVRQSKELFNEMVKRAAELFRHLKENKMPLAEAKHSPDMKWNCNYCPYRLECLKAG